jgi:hypothetical protein
MGDCADTLLRTTCPAHLMPYLRPPSHVPGLEAVAKAVERARRLSGPGPEFVICVCDEDAVPISTVTFGSFEQVQRFSRDMAALGYAAHPVGAYRDKHGCDVMYWRQESVRDIFDNGDQADSGPVPL